MNPDFKIKTLTVRCDLARSSVLWAIEMYAGWEGDKPHTLLYSPHYDYAPEIFYGTEATCIGIRESLRAFLPVPGVPKGWWAIIGEHGMVWSPGA